MMNCLKEVNNFLKYFKSTHSKASYKTYESTLKEAINYIKVYDDVIDIMPYRLHIANLSKRTISKKISILRSFLNFLRQKYKFKVIGDEHIKVPKTFLNPVKIEHIKKALKLANADEYLAIIIIFGLGLRTSEALNIRLKDIHNDLIEVRKEDKTRLLPLHPKLKNFIKKYLSLYPKKKYLFEKNGKQLSPIQLRNLIKKAFKRINLDVTPHQLRYSFAFYMLEKGARINDVSELLGYRFISKTKTYTQFNASLKLKNYIKAHPLCL